MRKMLKRVIVCTFLVTFVWCGTIAADSKIVTEYVKCRNDMKFFGEHEVRKIKESLSDAASLCTHIYQIVTQGKMDNNTNLFANE